MQVLSVRYVVLGLGRLLALLCSAAAFLVAGSAYAADVLINPAVGSYGAGETFTVTIQADPDGDQINAVEAGLSFDPAVVTVVEVSKTGSVFSLWTTEPDFSNTAGTISFGGGSPTPFSDQSTLLTVTLRAVTEGEATLAFSSASALAADGLGTDVLNESRSAVFTVAAATAPEPVPEPTPVETPAPEPEAEAEEESDNAAIAFGDPPRAPEVGSQAFLDPELWYNEMDGIFTWEIPFDVTAVAVEIATTTDNVPSDNPDVINDPPTEDFTVNNENLTDGIQYLSVQFENQVGWGGVTNRVIRIDTTPPNEFEIQVLPSNSKTGFPLLMFEAIDDTSGIEKYEVFIADKEPFEITPEEAKLGYLLRDLIDGTYTVRVTAFDLAGNERESSAPVLIEAGWTPPVEDDEGSAFWAFFSAVNIFILVLLLIIVIEFVYIIYERRQRIKTEEKLRKETREIQDQMEKIFSALRDEIYDQINDITKRPRLSAKEREAVEGLNQALEVSETLIEKEINDVKKILK